MFIPRTHMLSGRVVTRPETNQQRVLRNQEARLKPLLRGVTATCDGGDWRQPSTIGWRCAESTANAECAAMSERADGGWLGGMNIVVPRDVGIRMWMCGWSGGRWTNGGEDP